MPRSCKLCTHERREELDRALLGGVSSNLSVASLFGVSEAAVRRHKAKHLPPKLAKAVEAAEVAEADNLLEQVGDLQRRALDILDKAEEAGELRTALAAIREARSNIELLAKLLGELNDNPQVNVLVSPEFIMVQTAIVDALEHHPEAREAVMAALEGVDGG